MSLAYIRSYYGVPAYEGREVAYTETPGDIRTGRIVGANGPHLLVDFGPSVCEAPLPLHPTWNVTYGAADRPEENPHG